MASEYYDEDDCDAGEGEHEEDWFDDPRRSRFVEALTVFGLAFPFALLLAAVVAVIGIALVIGVVYAMMWVLMAALASGPDG